MCQICGKLWDTVVICYDRYDRKDNQPIGSNSSNINPTSPASAEPSALLTYPGTVNILGEYSDYPSPTFAPLMSSSESAQPPSSESSPSPSPPIPTSTINVHLMTTRAKVEISKPKIPFTYLTQVSSSTDWSLSSSPVHGGCCRSEPPSLLARH
ncbi:unnamed protein product [Citrullus colocynthis]|uniref:Uncharacterized protein n=1 Tax=Citrullus colocynthis TaxID=252529 RepID=A0ABP0Y5N9_9ROSI